MDTPTSLAGRISTYLDHVDNIVADYTVAAISKIPGGKRCIDTTSRWAQESTLNPLHIAGISFIVLPISLYVFNEFSSVRVAQASPVFSHFIAAVCIYAISSYIRTPTHAFAMDTILPAGDILSLVGIVGTGLLGLLWISGDFKDYSLEAAIFYHLYRTAVFFSEWYCPTASEPTIQTAPATAAPKADAEWMNEARLLAAKYNLLVSEYNDQEEIQEEFTEMMIQRATNLNEDLKFSRSQSASLKAALKAVTEKSSLQTKVNFQHLNERKRLEAKVYTLETGLTRMHKLERSFRDDLSAACFNLRLSDHRYRTLDGNLDMQAQNHEDTLHQISKRNQDLCQHVTSLEQKCSLQDNALKEYRLQASASAEVIAELREKIRVHEKDNEFLVSKRKAAEEYSKSTLEALHLQGRAFKEMHARCRYAEGLLSTKSRKLEGLAMKIEEFQKRQEALKAFVEENKAAKLAAKDEEARIEEAQVEDADDSDDVSGSASSDSASSDEYESDEDSDEDWVQESADGDNMDDTMIIVDSDAEWTRASVTGESHDLADWKEPDREDVNGSQDVAIEEFEVLEVEDDKENEVDGDDEYDIVERNPLNDHIEDIAAL